MYNIIFKVALSKESDKWHRLSFNQSTKQSFDKPIRQLTKRQPKSERTDQVAIYSKRRNE